MTTESAWASASRPWPVSASTLLVARRGIRQASSCRPSRLVFRRELDFLATPLTGARPMTRLTQPRPYLACRRSSMREAPRLSPHSRTAPRASLGSTRSSGPATFTWPARSGSCSASSISTALRARAKSWSWLAQCDYGIPFVAAIGAGRVFATQFHPEKSQQKGLTVYKNFYHMASAQLMR